MHFRRTTLGLHVVGTYKFLCNICKLYSYYRTPTHVLADSENVSAISLYFLCIKIQEFITHGNRNKKCELIKRRGTLIFLPKLISTITLMQEIHSLHSYVHLLNMMEKTSPGRIMENISRGRMMAKDITWLSDGKIYHVTV